MEVDRRSVRRVLDDTLPLNKRATGLVCAFLWDATREGYHYWRAVYRRLKRGKPLPDEARAKLVALLLGQNEEYKP